MHIHYKGTMIHIISIPLNCRDNLKLHSALHVLHKHIWYLSYHQLLPMETHHRSILTENHWDDDQDRGIQLISAFGNMAKANEALQSVFNFVVYRKIA